MGSELVRSRAPLEEGGGAENSAPVSFTKLFYEVLPYYMSIGLSWDDFWNGDCRMAEFYRKADELRRKERNRDLWLQGLYIYEAIGDMSPILRFDLDKKAKKPFPYPSEPFPLDEKEAAEQKARKEKEHAEQMKAKILAFAQNFNEQKKKEAVENGNRADG